MEGLDFQNAQIKGEAQCGRLQREKLAVTRWGWGGQHGWDQTCPWRLAQRVCILPQLTGNEGF